MVPTRLLCSMLLVLQFTATLTQVCDEETSSLMQEVAVRGSDGGAKASHEAVHNKATRRVYLNDLLQRTEDLIKSGVTPAVVEFAVETIQEINQTILPILVDETETDQNLLRSLYRAFTSAEATLATLKRAFSTCLADRAGPSVNHKQCRSDENSLCYQHEICEDELQELWIEVVPEEEAIADKDQLIHNDWCLSGENRSTDDFRKYQVGHFGEYIGIKEKLDQLWGDYNVKYAECGTIWSNYDSKTQACDLLQNSLEGQACSCGTQYKDMKGSYETAHGAATTAYRTASVSIKIEEADRKVEYSTLQMILCLLDNINDETNGSAKDAGVDWKRHFEECHYAKTEQTTHLDIVYNETPGMSPMPAVPTVPCKDDYLEEEEYNKVYDPQCTSGTGVQECSLCVGLDNWDDLLGHGPDIEPAGTGLWGLDNWDSDGEPVYNKEGA